MTESPDAESVKDMLTVIDKYNIKTIISLDNTDDSNEQVNHTIFNFNFALHSNLILSFAFLSQVSAIAICN